MSDPDYSLNTKIALLERDMEEQRKTTEDLEKEIIALKQAEAAKLKIGIRVLGGIAITLGTVLWQFVAHKIGFPGAKP